MQKTIILFFVAALFHSALFSQTLKSYKIEDLVTRIGHPDTVWVVNFWATWCAPCVEELPVFEAIRKKKWRLPVKVLLISLDFKEDYPRKIQSFIRKRLIHSEVIWLNETDADRFCPKINTSWSGAIPATLLYYSDNNRSNFIQGKLSSQMIDSLLHTYP